MEFSILSQEEETPYYSSVQDFQIDCNISSVVNSCSTSVDSSLLDDQLRNYCPWWDPNSQPISYKPSALAIELNSWKAIAGKELSLSSGRIASLCIYNFSTVVDFSSEKYNGST